MIQAKGLTRRFGDFTAVDQLDLNIERARIFGFLGPNGCGKTTAIRMLTGSLQASEGSVSVLGTALPGGAEALRLKVGYMTQKFSLYESLTVAENLEFVARIYALKGSERRVRLRELLATYGLEQKAKALAGSLSGGQKQRLALAAAVLHRPELLFLDEPTSAVDPENRREFWEQLFDLCDQGTSILVSTHYMDEAERCHNIAILKEGQKRADGTPEALMEAMDACVLELECDGLRKIKETLLGFDEVKSAAQLGTRLRVLIRRDVADPEAWIRQHISTPDAIIDRVRPSLEDVFVTSTGARHDA